MNALRALMAASAIFSCVVTAQEDVVAAKEKVRSLTGEGTTPIQKVLGLMTKLSEQIADEGKEEAKAYDKYACFCKEQADEKLYAIETSEKKIAALEAKISKLEADIAELNSQILEHNKFIDNKDKEIKTLTDDRKVSHDKYVAAEADVSNAIDSAARAIKALKDSKGSLEGKVDANSFAQIQSLSRRVLVLSAAVGGLSEGQLIMLNNIAKTDGPDDGVAVTYSYRSNDIISMVVDLKKKFLDTKNDLDKKEFVLKAAFDKKVLGLTNEKNFEEKDRDIKNKIVAEKEQIKAETDDDKTRETSAKTADNNFLGEITKTCQEKAGMFDQRSESRRAELQALTEAIDALEKGAVPNADANKKLVGLQIGSRPIARTGHWVYVEEPASFLQVRRLRGAASAAGKVGVSHLALTSLLEAAKNLDSAVLSTAAMRVRANEDKFAKVRQIIKDLIEKLEKQAAAEAGQKAFCDKEMPAALKKRDDEAANMETAAASIASKEAKVKSLEMDISTLSEQIEQNAKALLEATELRQKESDENQVTIDKATAGKDAVGFAISTLKDYYGAFLQTGKKYVPPNSDRSGNTVGDLAPDIFDSEYHGKGEHSGGIIGLLEVIYSDFDRTITTVTDQESTDQSEYDKFEKENKDDTQKKETDKGKKENQVITLKDDLVTHNGELEDATKQHGLVKENLEELSKICVQQPESYEERVAKREKEIEALKNALNILQDGAQDDFYDKE